METLNVPHREFRIALLAAMLAYVVVILASYFPLDFLYDHPKFWAVAPGIGALKAWTRRRRIDPF